MTLKDALNQLEQVADRLAGLDYYLAILDNEVTIEGTKEEGWEYEVPPSHAKLAASLMRLEDPPVDPPGFVALMRHVLDHIDVERASLDLGGEHFLCEHISWASWAGGWCVYVDVGPVGAELYGQDLSTLLDAAEVLRQWAGQQGGQNGM